MGAHIWEICDGKNTVEDIIEEVVSQFSDADPIIISNSVESFLNELEKEWLVLSIEEVREYD
jgi:Mg2+/Co2+ transporter CorB